METSTFLTSGLVLIVLTTCCLSASAQTSSNVITPSCTIKGHVTVGGQPVAGISIGASLTKSGGGRVRSYRSRSDQDGNYVIENLPSGNYQVSSEAPEFWIADSSRERVLILSDGEIVESIDFALSRGGVVTGKVTASGNRPLIAHVVVLTPDNSPYPRSLSQNTFETDDRGVYRAFGLPAGKYRLSVNGNESDRRRSRFRQTFFPGTTDSAKAELVEVVENAEVKGVDITVEMNDDKQERFSVFGRVVDAANQPVSEMRLQLIRIDDNNRRYGSEGAISDSDGQFKFAELLPGKYEILGFGVTNDLRSERTDFLVTDRDVSSLLVKAIQKASVSGIVVLETAQPKTTLAQFGPLFLNAFVKTENSGAFGESARVNSEGGFRMFGLTSGLATFSVGAIEAGGLPKGLFVARVERDGVVQSRGLEIVEGESITGVRVVLKYSNGIVRGVVRLATGALPSTARVQVTIRSNEPDSVMQPMTPVVDARGFFMVDGLTNGTYEIQARVVIPGSRAILGEARQTVTVSEGSVSEVLLTVEVPSNL